MTRLLFSTKAFAGLIRAGDSQRFDLDLKENREEIIEAASAAAIAGEIDLAAHSSTALRGKKCVSYSDYATHLLLRAIARHLRRRHRVALPSRDRIVRGVIETLMDGTPMYAIRRDITSFYESIPIDPIRNQLLYDTGTSSLVRSYLRAFFATHCPDGKTCGLPRGVGLSALFAEMSMTEFDRQIRSLPGVFKYYRFSDDILIFSTRLDGDLERAMEAALPASMKFNPKKHFAIEYPGKKAPSCPQPLDYLGYQFTTLQPKDSSHSRSVRVSIAARKINKLKSRIILSMRDFNIGKGWPLLVDRCRFITSNYKVRRHGADVVKNTTHVFSGIFYNYKMCGEYQVRDRQRRFLPYDAAELKALDGFYHSLLKHQQGLGVLTAQQLGRLRRFSFHRGYSHRIKARFSGERVTAIKRAWRNA